jgi:TRAP-type transport system small permease protein
MGRNLMVWLGGTALLAATAIDTLAVLGRNLGLPFIGSIELVQAAVLVSGTTALVLATQSNEHARVRLVTRRLRMRGRVASAAIANIAALAVFLALAGGSIWIAADLWDGGERSELLGVPWRVLRIIANAGLVACAGITLKALSRREAE